MILKVKEVTPDLIRERFGSVQSLARMLNVTSEAIYKTLRGGKYMDKLMGKICKSIRVEIEK